MGFSLGRIPGYYIDISFGKIHSILKSSLGRGYFRKNLSGAGKEDAFAFPGIIQLA